MDKLASPRSTSIYNFTRKTITLYDHLTNVVEDGHICMHAQLTLQNVNKECMVQRKVLPMANLRFCSTSPATGRPYWASTRSWCTWGTSALASEKTRRCNFPSPSPLIYDPSFCKSEEFSSQDKGFKLDKKLNPDSISMSSSPQCIVKVTRECLQDKNVLNV